MVMSQADVVELVHDQLLPEFQKERRRLDRIDRWYRWKHEDNDLPRKAGDEIKRLVELAKTPWLGLVVSAVSQSMYVDGYRTPTGGSVDPVWAIWQRNGMDARQVALRRAGLAYGQAYETVLPGDSGAVMRGVSPRKMLAWYADDVEDEWPMYGLRAEPSGKNWALRFYDEERIWYLSADADGDKVEYIEFREHRVGVCPIVRHAPMLDLDGRSPGEVEPFITTAMRINKTTFDRLMVQHFNSWKIRTAAGMAEPETEEEARAAKLRLRQDDLLIAEDPDTKFGTLDETPMDGFVSAGRADVETLAAVSQTPSHQLTGQMVNLSAEALAAAEAGLERKVEERKRTEGQAHDQALRLAAAIEGLTTEAADSSAHVTWADMGSRSLAQAVDALGKAATMLGIPPQALWGRIPGVTQDDVTEWKTMAEQGDPMRQLAERIDAQMADLGGTG
ncbi:phage portal protein [Nocardiopsis sp. TNDT3]|uniref:phage portal protein n=1 Tax=Nocardiopsis sp. TNDT3 TaxID=2249354 RepID=UPI000E3ED2C2|nr:phage portal protein [Nocardiopsis sp. TNDT3]